MEQLGGFSFLPLPSDKDGKFDPAAVAALSQGVTASGFTDLLVLSHGWNNEELYARGLYRRLLESLSARLQADHGAGAGRKFGVAGIFWPLTEFPSNWFAGAGAGGGGAAGLGTGDAALLTSLTASVDAVGALLGASAAEIAALKALLPDLATKPSARKDFTQRIQALLPATADGDSDNSHKFKTSPGDLIKNFEAPLPVTMQAPPSAPRTQGSAAGLGSFAAGIMAGASRLLNFTTYYTMKERAGVVGSGLNGVLGNIRAGAPALRLHLVGHSFGARVVTAAAGGATPFSPSTVSLLQGAFSHNGFSPGNPHGFFRAVIDQNRVKGPIMVTHTRNDHAVGILYALASRVSGVDAAAFGGADDKFGGIGSNGAQHMAAGEVSEATLLPAGQAYQSLLASRPNNLLADQFIKDHSDVTGEQVANAILAAIKAAP